MSMSEHQKLYSPSQWSKRFGPEKVIENFLKITGDGSLWARTHLNTFTYKLTQNANEEEVIQFFYKSPQSFSFEADGSLNFHGRNVFVFIHGGYWQLGTVNSSSFMAKNFIEKNIIVAALGYNLCPKVTMPDLVEEVERAVAKILKFSGESKVYLCGHSAGAHLAALMLNTNFKSKYNVDSKNLAGLVLVSGVYDLVPMIETEENIAIKLDTALAQRLSPILAEKCDEAIDKKTIDVIVTYGNFESPAFIEQSQKYSDHLKNVIRLSKVECLGIDADHFDIIEDLRSDEFLLTQKIYKMMNSSTA